MFIWKDKNYSPPMLIRVNEIGEEKLKLPKYYLRYDGARQVYECIQLTLTLEFVMQFNNCFETINP